MADPVNTGNGLDHVEVLIGVGEGLIEGLHDGLKTFYFGDTPFMQQDGTLAIKDAAVTVFPGEETPDPITFKLGGSAESTNVTTTLFYQVPVIRTTASAIGDVDALDVRLIVDYCDRHGTDPEDCSWKIEYKQSSHSSWLPFGTASDGTYFIHMYINTVKVFEWRQKVPRVADTYDIRVTKLEEENNSTRHVSTSWESFQEITIAPLTLPNTACVLVEAQATSQFSSLPSLWGVYDGLICHVPTNYDPVTRTFDESSGPWDGTFKLSFTNDPVWILREIITNDRFGMNAFFPATIDKFDCYDASKYTSGQVDDGHGGTQPRFTFNQWVSEPMAGMDMINMIAATFFGRCFDDGNGTIILRVDMDADPVALFTPEMVENGLFTYSYSDLNLRYNKITTTFINPLLNWNQDRRVVQDSPDQLINGIVPCDLQMPDCTDPQEACRRALFRMISALTEKETVTFTTNRMASTIEPWQVILIADPDMGYSLTGRIKTISGDRKTITFREAIPLEVGVTYNVTFQTGAGLIQDGMTVGSSGTYTTVTFPTALEAAVLLNMAFSIGTDTGTAGLPKPYRVLGIGRDVNSADKQTVTAIEINRLKYSLSDTGAFDLDVKNLDQHSDTLVAPPSNVVVTSKQFTRLGVTHNMLTLNWQDADEPHFSRYRIEFSLNGNPMQLLTETRATWIPYRNPVPGEYIFYVYTVNKIGNTSQAATVNYIVSSNNSSLPPPRVSGLEIENQANDNSFTSSDVKLAWRITSTGQFLDFDDEDFIGGAESGTHDSTFKDFFVEFYDVSTGKVFFQDTTKDPFYEFSFAQNRKCPGGPRRSFIAAVTCRYKHGQNSVPTFMLISNPAPAAVTGVIAELGPGTATFSWNATNEPDVDGYQVWRGTTPGFTPSDANLVYRGKANTYLYTAGPGTTAYLRVAAYDKFDVTLNYSAEYTLVIPPLVLSIPPGSITASKLGIQTSGMLMDTEFSDLTYWTASAGWALDSGADVTGIMLAPIAFKTPVGNGTTTQSIATVDTLLQTVEPNTAYRVRLDTLLKAGFTGQMSVSVRVYDRTKTLIGASIVGAVSVDGRTVAIATDTYSTLDGQITTPSNAHYILYRIRGVWSTTQNNAGFAYAARPQMQRATSSTLIVPSAILSSHIAQSAITASKLAIQTSSMVLDTDFTDQVYWTIQSTWSVSSNSDVTGILLAPQALLTVAGNGTTSQTQTQSSASLVTIEPNQAYRGRALALAKSGFNGMLQVQISWYDRTQALISTSTVSTVDYRTVPAASDTTTVLDGQAIAPSNAHYAAIRLRLQWSSSINSVGTAYFARAMMQPVVFNSLIADGTIGGTKLTNASVTGGKIAANTIVDGNLAANTITNASIALLTITTGLLAAAAVTGAKIGTNQITDSHMVAGTLTAASMANSTITGGKIAANTIVDGNLAANTITNASIALLTITTGLLATGAVTGIKIGTGQVTDNHMFPGTLTAASMANSTITGGKIAANTIVDGNLAANTITNASIALLTITTGLLAAGAVTSPKLAAGAAVSNIGFTPANIAGDTFTGAVNFSGGAYFDVDGHSSQTVSSQQYQLSTTISTGGSQTASSGKAAILLPITAGGTIATYTLTMPAFPYDGQYYSISTTGTITAFILLPSGSQSIIGAPTTLDASIPVTFLYEILSHRWWRVS